ncbi:MAG: DNA polymerase IV, partial [Candidatus Berkelbacteria bacterium]|nr:DNA polymerase IV [Candidatus Berkelbacteria bacterium]
MRKILHMDMNSYFATLEQQAHPNLRGKPIGVAGKGKGERTVICAASIEAKKFGLKSGMSTWEALRLCPQLIVIPATYDRYSFTSKRIFDLMERFGPKVDIFSIDEAFLELDSDIGWEDASIIAKRIKHLIHQEIGEWVSVSIGISYGKTLAKLASEMQKPDGLTIIRPEDFSRIAEITPIEELCGVGFRLRPRLNRMGITTIAELGRMPKDMLVTVFGDHTGSWLHQIGNGQDSNIIHSWRSLPQEKSIGHSYTLPHNISNMSDVKKVLLLLSERVGVRLRARNLVGKTISTYLRFEDGSIWGERHTQKEYLLDGYQIYQAGERLLNGLRQSKPVRLVAITVSDLVSQYEATSPLFTTTQANEQLVFAVDKINNRYGEWTVHRGLIHK